VSCLRSGAVIRRTRRGSTSFESNTHEGWGPRIGRETVVVTNSDAHSGNFSLLTTGRQAPFVGAAISDDRALTRHC
jgi:endo-1,4-beta-xylanase